MTVAPPVAGGGNLFGTFRMKKYLIERAKRVPIAGTYDVVVVGGGIAGVAAALAAARNGASVSLLEKAGALGGLATLGNVAVYLPLCDGMGHKVIGGLGEELLKLSAGDGVSEFPACWKRGGDKQERLRTRYEYVFNPASFLISLEGLVLAGGVNLRYDTRFCDVAKKARGIEAVLIEDKTGRRALRCRTVVDASGDADVCARGGEETVSVRTAGVAGWFYYYEGTGVLLNCLSLDPDGRTYAGEKAEDVTRYLVDTRQATLGRIRALKRRHPGRPVHPVVLPTLPGFRMTRRLKGRYVLTEADEKRCFDDAIGMTGDWRKRRPIYSIPFRCLIGRKLDNLIAAGRCISSTRGAWDVTRAIPACAVTGEAAGTAAALACRRTGGSFGALCVEDLQARLRKQKVLLDRRSARRFSPA